MAGALRCHTPLRLARRAHSYRKLKPYRQETEISLDSPSSNPESHFFASCQQANIMNPGKLKTTQLCYSKGALARSEGGTSPRAPRNESCILWMSFHRPVSVNQCRTSLDTWVDQSRVNKISEPLPGYIRFFSYDILFSIELWRELIN